MAGFFDDFGRQIARAWVQQRLAIPAKDRDEVAARTAQYTEDGEPLTVEEIDAADKAIIDYVEGRIEGTLAHKK